MKYFTFYGRASRAEYWLGHVLSFLALAACFLLLGLVGWIDFAENESLPDGGLISNGLYVVWLIYLLQLTVRRWHDLNKSGYWILIILIPILGYIYTWIECGFIPGTPTANHYGKPPQQIE